MKPVKDFGYRYLVSDKGNVWSVFSGRYLKEEYHVDGYKMVTLCKNGECKSFSVHRLVAEAFIPNPMNKRTVNHIDGNPANNDVINLEWSTHSENLKHAYDNNLASQKSGKDNLRSFKLQYICKDSGKVVGEIYGQAEASRVLGIPQGNISRALKTGGTAGGYRWRRVVEGVETIESTSYEGSE